MKPAGQSPTVVLMGLRGSGKSTIAPRLALELAGPAGRAVDLDDVTAAMLNTPSAAHAAKTLGWPKFRAGEFSALQDCLAKPYAVIALGGGTPTHEPSRQALENALRSGSIALAYLHASPALLADRLAATDLATRPSLTGQGVLEEIEQVYKDRDPLYRKLASPGLLIQADASLHDIVHHIVEALTKLPRH
jgi:shikimate kinase